MGPAWAGGTVTLVTGRGGSWRHLQCMKVLLMFLTAAAVPMIAGAQAAGRPTARAAGLSLRDVSSRDSTTLMAALLVGLKADSVIEVLPIPPVLTERPIRGANFMVTGLARQMGDRLQVSFRVFNVENSEILEPASVSVGATSATVGDSVIAAGRRIAQAIAATKRP
jgi:hypothetical protein